MTYQGAWLNNSRVIPSRSGFDVEAILSHLGEEEKLLGAVTPPIFQNSLFVHESAESLLNTMAHSIDGPPYFYSKIANPTVQIVEKKLAALDGMESCKVTGGGIGAISIALSSELESGAHAVVVESAYGPTRGYLSYMEKFGVSWTGVDGADPEEVMDSVKPETKLIFMESPSSLLFQLQDVPAITKYAREKGITTFFDNTYNTSLHMRPAEFGVDVVIQSASKYLGGHSDLNAGVICSDENRMGRIVRNEISHYANLLHPFSAWLLLRGLRTLKLRLTQHEAAANQVAQWLCARPEVERLHHISLPSFPQRDLYQKLMSGSGGLFSFEPVNQEESAVMAFCNALQVFQRGISWGGFESLVVPSLTPTPWGKSKSWVIRLFCGLEDPEQLRQDVEAALIHLA